MSRFCLFCWTIEEMEKKLYRVVCSNSWLDTQPQCRGWDKDQEEAFIFDSLAFRRLKMNNFQ